MRDFDGINDLYLGFNRGLGRAKKESDGSVKQAFFEGALEAVKSVFGLAPQERLNKSTHRPVKRHAEVHEDWESAYLAFQVEQQRLTEIGMDRLGPDSEILIRSVRALGRVDAFCRILDEDVDVELVREATPKG